MLKQLAVPVKWLLWFVLAAGTVVGVTYEGYEARIKYQRECDEYVRQITALSGQKATGADDCKDPTDYMPWWYVLIAWPEGITVWAIIFTLAAIIWQSSATSKAAKAALHQARLMDGQLGEMRRQATQMEAQLQEMKKVSEIENKTLILQFRPRIIVRNAVALTLPSEDDDPGQCALRLEVVNTGGSVAQVTGSEIYMLFAKFIGDRIDLKEGERAGLSLQTYTLNPGERLIFEERLKTGTEIDLEWMNFFRGGASRCAVYLIGTIGYMDELGIPRQSGIHRKLDPANRRFAADKESEQEYSD
jgi:hypothetical protein